MIRTPLSTCVSSLAALALLIASTGCGTTVPPSDPEPVPDPTATAVARPTAAPTVLSTAAPTGVLTTAPTASAAPVAQKPDATVDACRAKVADVPGDKAAKRTFDCPKDCASSWLWGDVVYTDDSHVCVAAIHAGAITAAAGGKVFVEPLPGRPQYFGSARNGVTSGSWSSFAGSVRIHAVGADGKAKEIPVPPPPSTTTTTTSQPAPPECDTSARRLVASGASATMTCPSGCESGWVYGSGPYTDDSSVCAAAIHAGVIPSSGGAVRVTLGPKLGGHQASTKNGVTTRSWSSEYVTFTVAKP